MSALDSQYELDTARAKTPAERLRIVADLIEAERRGEMVCTVDDRDGTPYRWIAHSEILEYAGDESKRLATKRRPVLVIPALEVFEGPMTEAPEFGTMCYYPNPKEESGYSCLSWHGGELVRERLAAGLSFATAAAAKRIGLHIRESLAKAVRP